MKKFILCALIGYILVFTLFIGLPQMIGGRGDKLLPKRGEAVEVVAATTDQNKVAFEAQKSKSTLKQSQVSPLIQDRKNLKLYDTGPVETFYRNGILSSEWILDPSGGGVLKTYTPEGRPWMIIPFVKNILDGEWKIFYPEGPLFSSEKYFAGERQGSLIWQYKNGNPWLEITWDLNGMSILSALYSENGNRVDWPLTPPEQSTGYFKAFDEHGHEIINMQRTEGEQSFILKSYYQSGTLSAEIGLQGKQLLGRMVRYYPDGSIWMETEFMVEQPLQNKVVYREHKVVSLTETPLMEPQVGLEWNVYYPDGELFWQLKKVYLQKQSLFYQLITHWQDEASANAQKERTLL